ncbi:MAG: hypothetical protein IJ605_01135 [Prevotella sp.]|nr:hypothetical protein [Prevotella sp.]
MSFKKIYLTPETFVVPADYDAFCKDATSWEDGHGGRYHIKDGDEEEPLPDADAKGLFWDDGSWGNIDFN